MKSFGCMPAVRTPEASRTLTMPHPGILPSPLRDKVGVFDHDRFRGYISVHSRSGLHPPCLRFAVAVAGRHARLGTRRLVRLCRGHHLRQLNFMRLQGATPHRSRRALLTHRACMGFRMSSADSRLYGFIYVLIQIASDRRTSADCWAFLRRSEGNPPLWRGSSRHKLIARLGRMRQLSSGVRPSG